MIYYPSKDINNKTVVHNCTFPNFKFVRVCSLVGRYIHNVYKVNKFVFLKFQ